MRKQAVARTTAEGRPGELLENLIKSCPPLHLHRKKRLGCRTNLPPTPGMPAKLLGFPTVIPLH